MVFDVRIKGNAHKYLKNLDKKRKSVFTGFFHSNPNSDPRSSCVLNFPAEILALAFVISFLVSLLNSQVLVALGTVFSM